MAVTGPVMKYLFAVYRNVDPCSTATASPLNENVFCSPFSCRPEHTAVRPVSSGCNIKLKAKLRIFASDTEILIAISGIAKAFPFAKLKLPVVINTRYRSSPEFLMLRRIHVSAVGFHMYSSLCLSIIVYGNNPTLSIRSRSSAFPMQKHPSRSSLPQWYKHRPGRTELFRNPSPDPF